jgi:3-oxoacyl-[acyl-carrier-protein] synthase II
MTRRVVVTGIGAITPLAIGADASWTAVCAGQCGIDALTLFDATDFNVRIAGEIKGWHATTHLSTKEIRRRDRYQLLAHYAIGEAMTQAALDLDQLDRQRAGAIVSSAYGGMMSFTEQVHNIDHNGARKIPPFAIPSFMTSSASAYATITYGFEGASYTITSACATGTDSIGHAFNQIRMGYADVMIAGGAEAPILPNAIAGLDRIGACSRANEHPAQAVRPFDRQRTGLVLSEGAGVLVLEAYDHAHRRGADILAEIAGYGSTSDAFHMFAPRTDGAGAARAITQALHSARLHTSAIDYINAHGTATELNDPMETLAIKHALGEDAYNTPISSTKGATGHGMGATGAIEAVFSILALRDGLIPPTLNLDDPDPQCDLDYVPQVARNARLKVTMSHSFGFGGHNAVLIFRRV